MMLAVGGVPTRRAMLTVGFVPTCRAEVGLQRRRTARVDFISLGVVFITSVGRVRSRIEMLAVTSEAQTNSSKIIAAGEDEAFVR